MDSKRWGRLAQECVGIPENLKFNDSEETYVEEIGDGNLNVVLRVYTHDGHSIIVKHSVPYIKCLGEGYPLGVERIDAEYKALVKFHQLSPGCVPQPYAFNKQHNAVFMEDLEGYQILRESLMNGQFDMKVAENLGHSLAIVHRETHIGKIGEEAIEKLYQHLDNSAMVNLTAEYVFTRPFSRADETNKCSPEVSKQLKLVYGDEQVLSTASEMRQIFTEKRECLIHGDLHAGSVMVKGTDTRMFDIEFCTVGPAAFDLGVVVANFIFNYHRHMSIEEDNDSHRVFAHKMVDACKLFVNTYLEHMTERSGDREDYVNNLLSETAGFAGCEIIRRSIGAAHYPYLEGLPLAEVDCLGAGIRLLQARHRIQDVDRLLVIALMLV
ncbi:methylthioribose kinase-like [Mercenaria mercenaria]|uniref:methylthioribose kinase-like n=1 Tax=Mercenaria mercenaria TaxID=6596 RepID=UPI00234ED8B4|nr:methylthioribose kinase-like [Mercenaria mercenaria]